MTLTQFTINDVRSWNPCYDPNKYLPEDWKGDALDILKHPEIPSQDKLWVVCRDGIIDTKVLQFFALTCAQLAEHLMEDERSKNALVVAKEYLMGKASREQLDEAIEAARAAEAALAARAAQAARAARAAAQAARAARAAEAAAWVAEAVEAVEAVWAEAVWVAEAAWVAWEAEAVEAAALAAEATRAAMRAKQIKTLIELIESSIDTEIQAKYLKDERKRRDDG